MYRDLIRLRRDDLRLFVDGAPTWLVTDDAQGLLAYERVLGDRRAVVAFNVSDHPRELSVVGEGNYRSAWPAGGTIAASGARLTIPLGPRDARVLNRR